MKKTLILLAVLAFSTTTASFAQSRTAPAQNATLSAASLATELGLDANQQAKVEKIIRDRQNGIARIRNERQLTAAELQNVNNIYDNQFKAVLTADQYAKYLQYPGRRGDLDATKMGADLGLDATQQAKIGKIIRDRQNGVAEARASRQLTAAELQNVNNIYTNQMQAVLTPAQYAQFAQQSSPAQVADRRAARLAKELGLDANQEAKIEKIIRDRRQGMANLRAKYGNLSQAPAAEVQNLNNIYDNQFKAVMTAEQYAKFSQNRQSYYQDFDRM
jgi:protein CpxP